MHEAHSTSSVNPVLLRESSGPQINDRKSNMWADSAASVTTTSDPHTRMPYKVGCFCDRSSEYELLNTHLCQSSKVSRLRKCDYWGGKVACGLQCMEANTKTPDRSNFGPPHQSRCPRLSTQIAGDCNMAHMVSPHARGYIHV